MSSRRLASVVLGLAVVVAAGMLVAAQDNKDKNMDKSQPQDQRQQDFRGDVGRPSEPMTNQLRGDAAQQVQQALMAVDRARASLDAGNRAQAINQLEDAKRHLASSHDQITGRTSPQERSDLAMGMGAQSSVVLVDPISQDRAVPSDRTRQYNNRLIVFGNADNAKKWDALSNSEKQQKFNQASDKSASEYGRDLGSDTGAQPGQQAVNSVCPVDLRQLNGGNVPANQSRTYNGQKVDFGSDKSVKTWDQMSDAEKQARLDAIKNMKADIENFKDPVNGQQLDLSKTYPDSQKRTYMGKKLGFASEDSAKQWDALSAQEKAQKFSGCQSIDIRSDSPSGSGSDWPSRTDEKGTGAED